MSEPLEGDIFRGISTNESVQLEDIIESDVPFSSERPNRTQGRAEWLATRSEAEFILYLDSLDLEMDSKVGLITFFRQTMSDWRDFISAGVEGATDHLDKHGDRHPLEHTLIDLVEDIYDKWDDATTSKFDFVGESFNASQESYGLGSLEGSEIVERMKALGAVAMQEGEQISLTAPNNECGNA